MTEQHDPTVPDDPGAGLRFEVTEADTAEAVGSGTLPVLGTPRLLAWMEAATCAVLEPTLADGQTSVGTRMEVQHLAPSPVGARLVVTADEGYADGRLHRFEVAARHLDDDGRPGAVVGTATVTRVVVRIDRFLGRL